MDKHEVMPFKTEHKTFITVADPATRSDPKGVSACSQRKATAL
jgi:hypothetical protein